MFVPRAREHPPEKPLDSEAVQHGQEVVSNNEIANSPLLMHKPATSLPSTSVSPASPNETGRQAQVIIKEGNEPAPNNLGLPIEKARGGPSELPIGAAKACKQSGEHSPKGSELAHRVPDDHKPPDKANVPLQWPNQEAISSECTSVRLHSQEPTVALTPLMPTPAPANALPVYSHSCSSPEPESQLCWKPPDAGEWPKQHAYHAGSDRQQMSIKRRSPVPGAVLMLPVARLPLAYITQVIPPRHPRFPPSRQIGTQPAWIPNTELVW